MDENQLRENADQRIDSCLICGTPREEVHQEDLRLPVLETLSMLIQPGGKGRFIYCSKCREYSVMTVY